MNELKSHRDTDLDRLSRLKALSWLSTTELNLLVGALALATFKRRDVILREAALASEVNILLTGIARITCMNARSERVTVALLAPGPIPEFPSLPISHRIFNARLTTIAESAASAAIDSKASPRNPATRRSSISGKTT